MKGKLSILGAIVAASLLSTGCNQSSADDPSYGMNNGNYYRREAYQGSGMARKPDYGYRRTAAPNESGKARAWGGYGWVSDGNIKGGVNPTRRGLGISDTSSDQDNTVQRKPNPLNVERLAGQIVDKKILTNPDGSKNVMLKLDTGNETLTVYIGPANQFTQSRISFEIGDRVEVKGSRMQVNDNEMFIASEITKGGNTLRLVDAQNSPLWGARAYRVQPSADGYYRSNGYYRYGY